MESAQSPTEFNNKPGAVFKSRGEIGAFTDLIQDSLGKGMVVQETYSTNQVFFDGWVVTKKGPNDDPLFTIREFGGNLVLSSDPRESEKRQKDIKTSLEKIKAQMQKSELGFDLTHSFITKKDNPSGR